MNALLICATLAFAAVTHPAASQKARPAARSAPTAKPKFPADRDKAVVAVTRAVLNQVYAGKVELALIAPSLRAQFTPAKVRTLRRDLRSYGPIKSITLVDRKAGEGRDEATLKIRLGDTVFIGTMGVTADNRLDRFLLLEE